MKNKTYCMFVVLFLMVQVGYAAHQRPDIECLLARSKEDIRTRVLAEVEFAVEANTFMISAARSLKAAKNEIAQKISWPADRFLLSWIQHSIEKKGKICFQSSLIPIFTDKKWKLFLRKHEQCLQGLFVQKLEK